MKKILLSLLITLFACVSYAAEKQTIKIVVPYATGGPVSILAHILQKSLATFGITAIVDYRPGAGGAIGMSHALNNMTEPVLILNTSAAILGTFKNPQPYTETQLIPVSYFGRIPLILIGSKKLALDNLEDLTKISTSRPIAYGTAGQGSAVHLATEKLNESLNLNLNHIPYRGTSQYLTDTISGNIDISFVFASSGMIAHIRNNDVVAIAVENNTRLAELPHVKTFKEYGIKNTGNFSWFVAFVGGKWEEKNLVRIQSTIKHIMDDPKLSIPFREFGLVWSTNEIIPPANFVERERKNLSTLIKKVTLN